MIVDSQRYERELGGINAKLEYIAQAQDKADTHFRRVFERLDKLDASGCARGAQNAKDIDDIRRQPGRTVAILAAVISALAAAAAWLGVK